jgi:hypothetical protein
VQQLGDLVGRQQLVEPAHAEPRYLSHRGRRGRPTLLNRSRVRNPDKDRVLAYRSIARRERSAAVARAVPSAENRSTTLKPWYLLGTLAPDQTSCKFAQTAKLQALQRG